MTSTHRAPGLDDEAPGAEPEHETELHSGFLTDAAHWLRGLLGPTDRDTSAVRRILDIGSGPGVASCILAHVFPQASVVAVDRSAAPLARAEVRAAERGLTGRIATRRAERPEEFGLLGGRPDLDRQRLPSPGRPAGGAAEPGLRVAARRRARRRRTRAAAALPAPRHRHRQTRPPGAPGRGPGGGVRSRTRPAAGHHVRGRGLAVPAGIRGARPHRQPHLPDRLPGPAGPGRAPAICTPGCVSCSTNAASTSTSSTG